MTWSVGADDELDPLPAAVEVAAYRIALEAVTNAHGTATPATCTVTLRRRPGALRVEVDDDGVGLGPTTGARVSASSSMRERAEELGGTLHGHVTARGGTRGPGAAAARPTDERGPR